MRAALHNNLDDTRRRFGDRFLLMLGVILLGYSLAGKGFAYAGIYPLYVGEACLALGVIAFLLARGWQRAVRMPAALVLLPLALWGAIRLAPGAAEHGVEAMRDAVIWGYAAFALVVATMIVSDPRRLPRLVLYYRRFIPIFLIGILVCFALFRFAKPIIPTWPSTALPLIFVKEGDVLVHLSGILAFWMADPKRSVRWAWAVLLTADMAVMGVIDRAGLLSFGAVLILCLIAKPRHGAAWRTIAMLTAGMILLWASMIRVEVPGGKGREISFKQFVVSFTSMVGSGAQHGLESTKQWRLQWWEKIIGYTFDGPYFWTGKGFGRNLATEDGFQTDMSDQSLRSPHNIHMTFLARMGVPGLALWSLVNVVWMWSVAEAWYRARRRGQQNWAGLFLFLFAYYLAFVINATFDVFLEGPMGGVWFWTIYGAGVGALWVFRAYPQVMEDQDDADDDSDGNEQIDEDPRRAQLLPAAGWGGPGIPVRAGPAGIARL